MNLPAASHRVSAGCSAALHYCSDKCMFDRDEGSVTYDQYLELMGEKISLATPKYDRGAVGNLDVIKY